MTVLESFLLCLGLVVGLIVGFVLGDYYGHQDGRKEQSNKLKRHLHQSN